MAREKTKLKNSAVLELFDTLAEVDKNSAEMDIAIKFKNKRNFRTLKEATQDIMDQRNELLEKFGKKETRKGKTFYAFKYEDNGKEIDNVEKYNTEVKKLMDIEQEYDITKVKVVIKVDSETGEGSAKGLQATTNELDILETIFDYELEE